MLQGNEGDSKLLIGKSQVHDFVSIKYKTYWFIKFVPTRHSVRNWEFTMKWSEINYGMQQKDNPKQYNQEL